MITIAGECTCLSWSEISALQQLTQIPLPVYHKQIMSTSSCASFMFFVRGKYLVISVKYFLFRAKWIIDTAYENCFWLWNVMLMWQTEKLLHSFWLSGSRLCETLKKKKRRPTAYFLQNQKTGDIVTWLILLVVIC